MQARTRRDATGGVRVPRARGAPDRPASPREEDAPRERPELRLALARGALAMELERPFAVGPVSIDEVEIALPSVRFPVDLSGGVSRFRHQRGELTRLAATLRGADLERWVASRLRGLLGGGSAPDVTIAPFVGGGVVGIAIDRAALCFDVRLAPMERGLRVLVDRARGLGLAAPAHGLALRALSAIAGSLGTMVSGVLVIDDLATPLLRQVLPLGGARVPSCHDVRVSVDRPLAAGSFRIRVERDVEPPVLDPVALSLLEVAELAGDADEAMARGDLDGARERYLVALERAPRHRDLTTRLASIDHVVGGRADAALATLVETQSAVDAGVLGAALLSATGDDDGASVAYARAAADETWSRLAALAWMQSARLATDREARAHALDQAIARSPTSIDARRERLATRLAVGDLVGARADAELLEAAARGASARFDAALLSARAFLEQGYFDEAVRWFERALRVHPDDAEAVLGLGRSLREAGRPRRALDLFARAVALAERSQKPAGPALLELAKELVATAADRPAAIARLRAIDKHAPEALEARALEVRFRLEIGDRAGAKLAAGRVADAIELGVEASRIGGTLRDVPSVVDEPASIAAGSIAREVAAIATNELGEPDLARRLLVLAVRAVPRDRRAALELRRLSHVAPAAPPLVGPPLVGPPPSIQQEAAPSIAFAPPSFEQPIESSPVTMGSQAPLPPTRATGAPSVEASIESSSDNEEDELMADRLADKLRADPTDQTTVLTLVGVLERLGRDMDLLALVSARMEEGDDEARTTLAPIRRACLERLASAAREAGRPEEASLYETLARTEDD